MSKNSKNGKTDADKLGEKRMRKYQERKDVQEDVNDDEYIIITAYQKIEPGEWEKIQIKKKRNKKL